MGTNYYEESSPSILVRYSSDNDSEDQVYPADPRLVQQHLDAQTQPPPPPPPPASPVSGVSTTSTTPFPELWSLQRSLTPSPTVDSPEGDTREETAVLIMESEEDELKKEITFAKLTTLCANFPAVTEEIPVFKLTEKSRVLSAFTKTEEEPDTECCCGCLIPVSRFLLSSTGKVSSACLQKRS